MKKTFVKAGLLAAGCLAAATTFASDTTEYKSGFYVAPGINTIEASSIKALKNNTDPKDELKSTIGFNLSGGYQFDSPWAVELMYQYNKPKFKKNDGKMKTQYLHLDGLYTFMRDKKWAPYVVAGVGRTEYNSSIIKLEETLVNAGGGIKYAFMDNLHARADARLTVGSRHGDIGASVNAALVYVFGSSSKSAQEIQPAERFVEKPVEQQEIKANVVETQDPSAANCSVAAAAGKVDNDTCLLLISETKEFNLDVKFALGSSDLTKDSQDEVHKLAQFLTLFTNTRVDIEGHTDSTGSNATNKRLSQERADAVKNSLVNNYEIDASRVNAKGYGSEKPIAENTTAEGRLLNRRVVAKVRANGEE